MSALERLTELAGLVGQLPEPARARADELVAELIDAEARRVRVEAKRVQPMVAARLIPPDQRTAELAAVLEYTQRTPQLSARERRRRLAAEFNVPQKRIRQYQAVLALFARPLDMARTAGAD